MRATSAPGSSACAGAGVAPETGAVVGAGAAAGAWPSTCGAGRTVSSAASRATLRLPISPARRLGVEEGRVVTKSPFSVRSLDRAALASRTRAPPQAPPASDCVGRWRPPGKSILSSPMQRASIASRGSRPGGGAAFLSAIAADRTTVVLAVNHRASGRSRSKIGTFLDSERLAQRRRQVVIAPLALRRRVLLP
jgi:hypothetical protein